jgi:SPP1 gp7 family putative phage head morphogenesis protein
MPESPDDAAAIRRADRERRKREDRLLILLLFLLGKVQRTVGTVAIHGLPVSSVIRSMVAGNGITGHPGAAPLFARTMAQAHRDGYRRAGLMAGTRAIQRADAGSLAELSDLYRPAAQRAADAMADTLDKAVALALAAALADGLTGTQLRQAVREAFRTSGYDRENPYAADLGAERAVVTAHNGGILAAVMSGQVEGATGLAHRSVIDDRTTDICRERDGLMLPVDDPYWLTNCPSLHYRCRSVLQPLTGEFTPSDWRPTVPPMAGFGAAPAGFLAGLAGIP